MTQDWSSTIRSHLANTSRIQEFQAAMKEETRDDGTLVAASDWAENANTQAYNRLNTAYPVEELSGGLETINFFYADESPEYKAWYRKMTHTARKAIPLGCTKDALYQLRPDPCGLFPDNRSKRDTMRLSNVASSCFLGVNMNVPVAEDMPPPGNVPPATYPLPPRTRNPGQRNEQRSYESTETADSEDDSTGFVFHQLGALEWAEMPKQHEHYPGPGDFSCTDFYVVARLSSSGGAESLWIIQDKFPDDVDGERPEEPDQDVGCLDWEHLKISMARLHRDGIPLLSDRTFNTPITWLEPKEDQMELVNVKKMASRPSLVRLTIYP